MTRKEIFDILDRAKSVFFTGIGGISMSSIAFVLSARGKNVAGSDRAENDMTKKLISSGISVFHGHDAKNVVNYDAVVYTGAVDFSNPELSEALKRGIPVIYRADALAYLMQTYKNRIGVSGSHGKSTCTAMISHIFVSAGNDPCVMCGATLPELSSAYRVGGGDDFIFEACEYKDSFLEFLPSIAVILNIDVDHTDYFTGGIEQIKTSFEKYAAIPFECSENPLVVSNADDENTVSALSDTEKTTFGIKENADFRAVNISSVNGRAVFDILKHGDFFCHVKLKVPGEHNIYNALAAAVCADFCGIPAEATGKALSDFCGIERRFQLMGSVRGADVYIDYAHHPREIAASLSAAREIDRDGKLYCIFEPHTFSRTAALFDDFVNVFSAADKTLFVDIYAAREVNVSGVDSRMLAEKTRNGEYTSSYADAAEKMRLYAKKGDIILILGAGTVNEIASLLCDKQ